LARLKDFGFWMKGFWIEEFWTFAGGLFFLIKKTMMPFHNSFSLTIAIVAIALN
jgi:hypothetical protein